MADDQLVTWASCSYDGCIGVRLATAVWCLGHAATRDPAAFEAELKRIGEDGTVDARGVHLSTELLDRVLVAVPHQDDGPVLKAAQFKQATFQGGRGFEGTTFLGEADFWGATFQAWIGFKQAMFQGDVIFMGARFQGEAVFDEATFQGDAVFDGTSFEDYAWFGEVTFQQTAAFNWAVFEGRAEFNGVRFEGYAEFTGPRFHHGADFHGAIFRRDSSFSGASFEGVADFGQATFERVHHVGPLAARQLVLDGAVFSERVQLEVAAAVLCARRTKFPAGVRFRLRWACVVLDDADLAAPTSLAGVPPFPDLPEQDAARRWQRLPPGPRTLRWRP